MPMETPLVHKAVVRAFLPRKLAQLYAADKGCELRGCEAIRCALVPAAIMATEEDWHNLRISGRRSCCSRSARIWDAAIDQHQYLAAPQTYRRDDLGGLPTRARRFLPRK